MFESLPGFREFYPDRCAIRNHLFRLWKETALCFGFAEYDAPLLEPLDLFKEKSGDEIVGQLFAFRDRGEREVALRPEMTPSLARLVGARAQSLKQPIKWFNIGEHFRYERPQKGRTRSFYQFNADIFGEPGPGADAELIALCIQSLTAFGLTAADFQVRLSDRDLWAYYLAGLGLEDERAIHVLNLIDKIARQNSAAFLEKLKPYFADAAEDFLLKLDTLEQIRDRAELRAFMLSHAPCREIKEKLEARLTAWETLLSDLEAMHLLPFLRLDLGVVRGLAYYTGFVFEVFAVTRPSRSLAGGGRYDHLVKKLGYRDLPAVGFAIGDVTLTDLLKEKKLLPPYIQRPDLYAVVSAGAERKVALSDIAQLRAGGFSVEHPLKPLAFSKQFKLAGQSGSRLALIYGAKEIAADTVKVRHLGTGLEKQIPRSHLLPAVREIFEHGFGSEE